MESTSLWRLFLGLEPEISILVFSLQPCNRKRNEHKINTLSSSHQSHRGRIMLLTHRLPSSSSSQWSAKRTVIVDGYAASLSSPETQGWPLSYFHGSLTHCLFLNLWASISSQLKLSHPEPVPLTALIFFHWRSSSALSLVSLKRLVLRPSDILMPYWNAALRDKKGSWGKKASEVE